MAERLYRIAGGEGLLPEHSFHSEDNLVDALATVAGRNHALLQDLSVHVYDTAGLGREYLGMCPAQNVAVQGKVDESILMG